MAAGQRELTWAELDAVTLDAYGTLLTLVDPVPALQEMLRARGAERAPEEIAHAFRAEFEHYRRHAASARDASSLAVLNRDCAAVFSDAIGAAVDADTYVGALRFELLDGVVAALESLRERGVSLAVVANWEISLHDRLTEAGIAHFFDVVIPAADKPDPAGLLDALAQMDVEPVRALHVGDAETDEQAARAAGMHFLPAPLPRALAAIA